MAIHRELNETSVIALSDEREEFTERNVTIRGWTFVFPNRSFGMQGVSNFIFMHK